MFPWGAERCLSCSPRGRVYINYIILYLYKLVYTLHRMRTIGEDICLFLLLCVRTHIIIILLSFLHYIGTRHLLLLSPPVYTHTRPTLLPPVHKPISRKGATRDNDITAGRPRIIGTCGISRQLPHTCPARPQVN